jgi:hypothetical protein
LKKLSGDAVCIQGHVDAHDRDLLDDGLGDDHAVERVFVVQLAGLMTISLVGSVIRASAGSLRSGSLVTNHWKDYNRRPS